MDKKAIRGWMMYDWANSAFATTIMAAVLPVFYSSYYAAQLEDHVATSFWGYTQSIGTLFVALLAPILGAISDYSSNKKQFLRFFAYMGMIASVLFAFVGQGLYVLASILMIIGTIGFSGGNVFYDAFLPEVAKGKNIDKISTAGFAFGYIGGGVLLAINLFLIMNYKMFGFANEVIPTKISLASVGLWWFIFSIPMFKNVKEKKIERKEKRTESYVAIGFKRVGTTFKTITQYKQLLIFLVAFWMYNDGISTIIKMATAYGAEIGIGTNDLIAALLITQFVGIPCTFFFGWLASKIKVKTALLISLWIYVGIVVVGYFMSTALHFYLLAICVGFVQGGAQALSRSIYGRLVPENKKAEFFGFYGVSSKFAAIFGPFVFSTVGLLSGSSRLGILALVLFFLVGIIMLHFVDIEKGEKEAQQAAKA